MSKDIILLKNNDERDWEDLKWINEFYNFLQGDIPSNIYLKNGHKPKLTKKKAFSVIYYLQEQLPVFPDYIEKCSNCGDLYNAHESGLYWEAKQKHFCGCCEHLVPDNYDNNQRC